MPIIPSKHIFHRKSLVDFCLSTFPSTKPPAVAWSHSDVKVMSSSATIIAAYGPCGSVMEMMTVWMEVTRRATAAVRMLKWVCTAFKHTHTLYVQIPYMLIHLHAQPCTKQEADSLLLSASMFLNVTELRVKRVPPPHCCLSFCSRWSGFAL